MRAGLQIVCAYADLALKRYPWIPFGSELFWRVVKLQHAMGSRSRAENAFRYAKQGSTADELGRDKAYELTDAAKRLHLLLRVKPGRFALKRRCRLHPWQADREVAG